MAKTLTEDEAYKEIRVTIDLDGKRYGYRQMVPLEGIQDAETLKQYTAYAIASEIQDTILERWDD
jgi:hypothetical protein